VQPPGDDAALHEIAALVLPGSGRPSVERAERGVSTPVYRIRRAGTTFYLRLAEGPAASLTPEVLVHNRLRAAGVRVPAVVHFEPFNRALGRSVMVTTEIPGTSIDRHHRGVDIGQVLVAAGRDLAIVNGIAVAGFGWIRRDRPPAAPLAAALPSLRAFALDNLDAHLAALRPDLTAAEIRAVRRVVARGDAWLDADRAILAHGDLDVSHIFHVDGRYTGMIDFGEIRGADPLYDLGHVALHDGETIPEPALPHLLTGYGEAAPLPADHELRIRFWSLLIGVRALARRAGRPWSADQAHLAGAIRAILRTPPT